jgi:hypothetical protein
MTETIEVNHKGRWTRVPALNFGGFSIIVQGTWLKLARIHDEAWLENEMQDPSACVTALKAAENKAMRADIFTFTQKPGEGQPTLKYAFEPESIAVACCANFKQWWESLPQESRKNVRRSQKRGVVVSVQPFGDALLKGIWEVNQASPSRQGKRNYYHGRGIEQLKKDYSAFVDRSDFVCAYLGDEMVGFAKLVYRGKVASILNFTPNQNHADKRVANAMMAKAVEICEGKGISYLTYGMYNYGNKQDSPLREFKIRNGFEEVKVPRFYIPLNPWGELCLKLKLHRGMLQVLPPAAVTAWLNARERLRSGREWISRCSSMLERPNRNRQMERSTPPAGSNS